MTGRYFSTGEVTLAAGIALVAQGLVLLVFVIPPPEAKEVEISDENAKPIAVSVTPVPLLKKGSKNPAKLPKAWEREAPVVGKGEGAQPSREASTSEVPSRVLDAGVQGSSDASGPSQPTDAGATNAEGAQDGSTKSEAQGGEEGHAEGSTEGTETNPLKARAADLYRAQLSAWFASRFAIRGKLPFDDLKRLKGVVTVQVSSERHVTDYTLTSSGDPIFDQEVKATLERVKSSGTELPAPPPLYPEMLGPSLPIVFRCTIRSQCE